MCNFTSTSQEVSILNGASHYLSFQYTDVKVVVILYLNFDVIRSAQFSEIIKVFP